RLQESANGAEKVLLHAEGGKPVSLTYKEAWRLDSARLKKENPGVWVQYAKKTGNWELREERRTSTTGWRSTTRSRVTTSRRARPPTSRRRRPPRGGTRRRRAAARAARSTGRGS